MTEGVDARAAIYARRSTEEQGASLDRQIDECTRFAESRGWIVVEEYADTASGWRSGRRPQFEAMLAAAGRGAFTVLVVWEISRLSRRAGDESALALFWQLQRLGVEVHSVIEQSTGIPLADELTVLIKGHIAKGESDVKSQRVRSGKMRGLIHGVHQARAAAYGYDEGHPTHIPGRPRLIKMYKADPVTALVVQEIFVMYVERRMSPRQIADYLDAKGVVPPWPDRPNPLKRSGKPMWHQSTIKDLIRNPALAGWAVGKNKQRVKACACADRLDPTTWALWQACDHAWVQSMNMPGIIDPDLWERAQVVRAQRTRPHMRGRAQHAGNERFLLCGLLRCGRCGERMTTRRAQRPTDIDRYVCQGRRIGRCDLPRVPRAPVDEAVRESFVNQFLDQVDLQRTLDVRRRRLLARRHSEANQIAEHIASIDREVTSARSLSVRALADYESGAITPQQWSRLDTECHERANRGEALRAALRDRMRALEVELQPTEVDALLDRIASVSRVLAGQLTAVDTPVLNAQLGTIFEGFVLTVEGQRTIVHPKLKPEWVPEGDWTILDFGEADQVGVEVVDYIEPVMRRIDLLADMPL